MQKKRFVILIFLSHWFFAGLVAQEAKIEAPKNEIVLKLYVNFLAFNSEYQPSYYQFQKEFMKFWGITPAISFHKNNSRVIHEFEPKFWFSSRDDKNINEFEVGLRYELCWFLDDAIFRDLRFEWGISSRFSYYNANILDTQFGGFTGSLQSVGFELAATLHLEYRITQKINIEFSFTNLNYNFAIEHFVAETPGSGFSNTASDILTLGQRVLRIGVGYNL